MTAAKMPMNNGESTEYHEAQYFRQVWWVMLIILGAAVLMWWGFIQQIIVGEPWGTDPAPDWIMWLLWLFAGIGLPLLFGVMGLIVEVHNDRLQIRYVPLTQQMIMWDEIGRVTVHTYKPIRQFGGWGIRGSGKHRAFSVKGNRGVELSLKDGRHILIGSQNPEDLALAIESKL